MSGYYLNQAITTSLQILFQFIYHPTIRRHKIPLLKASLNKETKKTLPNWVTQVRQQPQNVPFSLMRWFSAQGGAFFPATTAQSTELQ
jgi:hypothetical protein